MQIAIKEALKAKEEDEVPIGAVIVQDGKVLSKAHNIMVPHLIEGCEILN